MPASSPEPLRYRGLAFRALNPVWAGDPLSGEGARRHGGRFNPKGMPALYTALTVMGAIREVSQIGQPIQPTTLVTYDIDTGPVFDATDPSALAARGLTPADIAADDWRLTMASGNLSAAQSLAGTLAAEGYTALRAPSFARGSRPVDHNLILLAWGPDLPSRVTLIDDEDRLGRHP